MTPENRPDYRREHRARLSDTAGVTWVYFVVLLNLKFVVCVLTSQRGVFWLDEDSLVGSCTVGLVATARPRGSSANLFTPINMLRLDVGPDWERVCFPACVCSQPSFLPLQLVTVRQDDWRVFWQEVGQVWQHVFFFFNNQDEKLDVTALLKTKQPFC